MSFCIQSALVPSSNDVMWSPPKWLTTFIIGCSCALALGVLATSCSTGTDDIFPVPSSSAGSSSDYTSLLFLDVRNINNAPSHIWLHVHSLYFPYVLVSLLPHTNNAYAWSNEGVLKLLIPCPVVPDLGQPVDSHEDHETKVHLAPLLSLSLSHSFLPFPLVGSSLMSLTVS